MRHLLTRVLLALAAVAFGAMAATPSMANAGATDVPDWFDSFGGPAPIVGEPLLLASGDDDDGDDDDDDGKVFICKLKQNGEFETLRVSKKKAKELLKKYPNIYTKGKCDDDEVSPDGDDDDGDDDDGDDDDGDDDDGDDDDGDDDD